MPAPDLALLAEAARAAGEVALRYWKNAPRAWEKAEGAGPVTEADLAVNDLLESRLRAARPDYGWLSEESADSGARRGARRVFIIDPIDGTRAFMAGEDTFAHSLAVAEAGQIVAAAVYLPALDRLYTASTATPAMRDGQPIRASSRTEARGATLLATRPMLGDSYWPGGVPDVKRSFRASLAFRLCLVAEGRHDGMLTLREAWEWDIAAGSLIAARAGATVTDRLGQPLVFNSEHPQTAGVIAAAPGLHADLMGRLTA
ncbi:3'(2'),5'-bisphosphate nucleotidase CysQ [Cereibacter azotoformans]|uniref:Myo-inositol-1(Or 4)-monophosphatase n=1 Tax=Cereibacter azotoformans TaxID=43057 RepID=A0A2T5K324_9RHOB|nr:3'(2'),5'-bisphosphate nucleotidase CysQ [Cereibacter azotoformans]AXQ94623.1 3'(2'),5'-bisphosphate nucleotidase CysQ [Cereibacter sphaeroides]MBO4170531.1 3'(2'),5'-bisphosphate nucleotidase CysQ [Cereibacter azotoformans]PTR16800.1 myo-inositol-1(or 4)-monophosphatase [Cereibacter azotoformans]UIJ30181.1 3'(2'),5'-bisphosphate nucleotidase CysQ [Cereibacter azotoformans]